MGNAPELKDKMICAALYTGVLFPNSIMPWVPIVWIIIMNIRKSYIKDFVKYHCYQAILFNMIVFALPQVLSAIVNFIATLLSITVIFEHSGNLLVGLVAKLIPLYFLFVKVVAIYAIIWTARGRFTYMPPISQAVNLLLR